MTEEEARKKVCKQVLVWNQFTGYYDVHSIMCIASACAKWEWITSEHDPNRAGDCGLKK